MRKPHVDKNFWTGVRNASIISIAFWLCLIACCTGCGQRQVKYYEYDENTGIHREWEYKNNSLASKQELDWLYLDMPNKGRLFFGPYVQDNDSFRGGYGPFWMGTNNSPPEPKP